MPNFSKLNRNSHGQAEDPQPQTKLPSVFPLNRPNFSDTETGIQNMRCGTYFGHGPELYLLAQFLRTCPSRCCLTVPTGSEHGPPGFTAIPCSITESS
jgi:hypothetical protein